MDSPRVALLGVMKSESVTCLQAYCSPNLSRGEGKEQVQAQVLPWDSKDRNILLPRVPSRTRVITPVRLDSGLTSGCTAARSNLNMPTRSLGT